MKLSSYYYLTKSLQKTKVIFGLILDETKKYRRINYFLRITKLYMSGPA